MTEIAKEISNKMAKMGFVCACLVVSIHVGLSGDRFSFVWCLKEFVAEGVARISVPFFFLASGFFLGNKFYGGVGLFETWKTECAKRLKSLLIPYWIWNFLYAPFLIGFAVISDFAARRAVRSVNLSEMLLRISGIDFVNSPILFPLWYVRSLFFLVLVSPIIVVLLRRTRGFAFVLFWLGHVICNSVGMKLPSVLSLQGVAYFSCGMSCGMGLIHINCVNKKSLSVVVMTMGLFVTIIGRVVGLDLLPFSIPIILFGMWGSMDGNPWPRYITSQSFPIYLLHMFVLLVLQYSWRLTSWMPTSVEFLFRWVMAIGVSVLIACSIRRFIPRFANVVFGGR